MTQSSSLFDTWLFCMVKYQKTKKGFFSMKKLVALILSIAVIFCFASCSYLKTYTSTDNDKPKDQIADKIKEEVADKVEEKVAVSKAGGDLIGVWTVSSTQINSTDTMKTMLFDLMNSMYFFEGAKVEFRDDGKTSMNGMLADFKVPRANVIETTNAQGEVTECTYNISGNTLTMNFYSDQYIVTLVK